MALCPHLAHMHTQTYKHTHATFGSGRRGILFNGIMLFFFFFSLLSPFPQTPCLPCQENNESTKPFVRTSTQHFHLRPPTHPQKKQPTLHSHLPNVISTLSHFHPPTTPCPHACLPAPLLAARPRRQAFFLVISSARSRCARDYCKMKVGEGGGRPWEGGEEVRSGRPKVGGRHYQLALKWWLQRDGGWEIDVQIVRIVSSVWAQSLNREKLIMSSHLFFFFFARFKTETMHTISPCAPISFSAPRITLDRFFSYRP